MSIVDSMKTIDEEKLPYGFIKKFKGRYSTTTLRSFKIILYLFLSGRETITISEFFDLFAAQISTPSSAGSPALSFRLLEEKNLLTIPNKSTAGAHDPFLGLLTEEARFYCRQFLTLFPQYAHWETVKAATQGVPAVKAATVVKAATQDVPAVEVQLQRLVELFKHQHEQMRKQADAVRLLEARLVRTESELENLKPRVAQPILFNAPREIEAFLNGGCNSGK